MNRVIFFFLVAIVFVQQSCQKHNEVGITKKQLGTEDSIFEEGIASKQNYEAKQQNQMETFLLNDPIKPTQETNFIETLPEKTLVPENMIFVPGGDYLYVKEKINSQEKIRGFLIHKKIVSVTDFSFFITSTGYKVTDTESDHFKNTSSQEYLIKKKNVNLHVAQLSWYEAEAYCRWKGMRLPTVKEWQFAVKKVLRYEERALEYRTELWEWTNDWQLRKGEDLHTFVPDAESEKIVLSWKNIDNKSITPWLLASMKPRQKFLNVGCRCVKDIQIKR
ncbi:MAG: SUMF1/EgtB/PvdO family nonheme iron enzyme [Bacteroidota bacterium]